jgi:hypothetical protein
LGGTRDESAADVAVDGAGNAYVTGATTSSNFPTVGPIQPGIGSGSLADAFVTKIDATSTAWVYSTYLGGNQYDDGLSIAVDSMGRAYVAGDTGSRDFPTQSPVQDSFGGGEGDAFVAILDPAGRQLLFSTFLGGRDSDTAESVALGPPIPGGVSGFFVAGATSSADFPTSSAFQSRFGSNGDAFVTGYTPGRDGAYEYRYSTYLGGTASDAADAIAVDGEGAAYIAGSSSGTGYPLADPFQRGFRGGTDVVVTKLAPDGQSLVYSTYLGGRDDDTGRGIAVANGQAVVTGDTASQDYPTESPFQRAIGGTSDAFVTCLAADGQSLIYSTFLGGTGQEQGWDVALDGAGAASVVGSSNSLNFPAKDGVQAGLRGNQDAVVASLSADGRQLTFGTYLGGSLQDNGNGLARQGDGLFVVGYTESANFPVANAVQPLYGGLGDAFVARIEPQGEIPTASPTSGVKVTETETAPTAETPTASVEPSETPTEIAITSVPTETETPTATPSPTATEAPAVPPAIYLPAAAKNG